MGFLSHGERPLFRSEKVHFQSFVFFCSSLFSFSQSIIKCPFVFVAVGIVIHLEKDRDQSAADLVGRFGVALASHLTLRIWEH